MHPWTADRNSRVLAGAGIGVRVQLDRWTADASFAHATHGGPAPPPANSSATQVWVVTSLSF